MGPDATNPSTATRTYRGATTWRSHNKVKGSTTGAAEATSSIRTLGETESARCDLHSVQRTSSSSSSTLERMDWIFLEQLDRVVVAVTDVEENWILVRQKRFGIPGDTATTAPAEGSILFRDAHANDESPFEAARRTVLEQLGMKSSTLTHPTLAKYEASLDEYGLKDGKVPEEESRDWTFLGRFRTMADRGGGFTYCYLVQKAIPATEYDGMTSFKPQTTNEWDEKPELVTMNAKELRQTLENGGFPCLASTATVSLALQRLDKARQTIQMLSPRTTTS
jgi:hypothetical protein